LPIPQETGNLGFAKPGVHGPVPLGIALQIIGILLISLTISLAAIAGLGGLKEGGVGLPDLGSPALGRKRGRHGGTGRQQRQEQEQDSELSNHNVRFRNIWLKKYSEAVPHGPVAHA